MSELIKCPFCENGGRPALQTETYDMGWAVERWVECEICGARGEVVEAEEDEDYKYADELAIEKWNTRPFENVLRAELYKAQLAEQLMKADRDKVLESIRKVIAEIKEYERNEFFVEEGFANWRKVDVIAILAKYGLKGEE